MNLTPKNTEKDEEREGGRQEGRQKAAVINRRLTKQRVQTIPGWLLTDSLCNSLNRDDGLQRAQSSCPYALAEPASCLTNCLVSEHKAQPSRSRRWETWVPWTVAPGKTIFLITEQLSIISGDGGETYMSSSKEGTCQPFFIFLKSMFRFLFNWSTVDLQRRVSFRYTAKQLGWTYTFFSRFFFITCYFKILNIVSCAIVSCGSWLWAVI